ncbi:MAG: redox-sensing transcriptional repressor Rex [Chloroflexi bacterium]|nr:redox-sensing transcriptional repressor Rex [Chloroflexota bacterium]MDA1218067.1 redox-sensing transcriptional repressor Rex [Chloroflexota bacterium]PKB57932.1 MAG: redox-sensing transcriptional repressor Rex [SAR202 cluster bacterium Casp-Chloro-G3]
MADISPSRWDDQSAVPEVVVGRLPQYVRVLKELLSDGVEVANSQQLGQQLQVTPAQIRKDLSYFGRFGKQGRGYSVRRLLDELQQILGLNEQWNVVVVGVGRLGKAILSYPGFTPDGFHIVAALDNNPSLIGQEVEGVKVRAVEELDAVVKAQNITIAVVAVPVRFTQQVIDKLVECGIRAILNYAPTSPQVPESVKIRSIDPVLSLQSMTYYLTNGSE